MIGFGRKKWGVLTVIFDERAEGGMEFSLDLARRIVSPNDPNKSYYVLKKRKIRTKPSEFYRLIPGPKGIKCLPLYGVSQDELYALEFKNFSLSQQQMTDKVGRPVFYKTIPIFERDESGNILFWKPDENGKPTPEKTMEKSSNPSLIFPIIEKYEIEYEESKEQKRNEDNLPLYYKDVKGQPIQEITIKQTQFPVMEIKKTPVFTTEETEYPVIEKKISKIVEPSPQELRHWLANTAEEDRHKYQYRSFWQKWGAAVALAIMGASAGIIILFTLWGLDNILKDLDVVSQGLGGVAKSLDSIAGQLAIQSGVQVIT